MGQGARRKIRAVFVVDVPERRLAKNPADIRNLEKHDRAARRGGDAANRLRKTPGFEDVLQRHLAADQVGSGLDRGFGEEFLFEDCSFGDAVSSFRNEARVVAGSPVAAELAQEREKFALAAADFHDLLANDIVPADQLRRELAMEGLERRRKALRLLIALRIDRTLRLPCGVEYEAAIRAEGEIDVAQLQALRTLAIGEQKTAVHRYRGNVKKNTAAHGAAIRTSL